MKAILLSFAVLMTGLFICGCDPTPKEPADRIELKSDSDEAINKFKEKDPSIQRFFENAHGYAIMPKIFKGAFIIGAAYGRGEVYEKGQLSGYCDMKQASGGISIGGEFYRELIFFKTDADYDKFTSGNFAFAAQVTGVAVTLGAAAKADYSNGMAVFIMEDAGAMVDASVGGQKFDFDTVPTMKKVELKK